jgi:hypothetical protein
VTLLDTIWGGKNITSLYLERRQYLVVLFRGGDTILRHYFGRFQLKLNPINDKPLMKSCMLSYVLCIL